MTNFQPAIPDLRYLVSRLAPAVPPIMVLAIYLLTMPPSLTWAHHGADGGDLVTAVARGSIPHPPGFPTYLLLGALFIRLPWGEPAWRLNLMSAVLAVGAVALTATAVGVLTRIRTGRVAKNGKQGTGFPLAGLCSPICTGLCLGLAPLFWSQALITEVYAPAAFCSALVAALALRGGPAWALGVAWGMGMGVHPTLMFLAPLVAWGAWGEGPGRLRRLVEVAFPTLLSCGAMYGAVLQARSGVSSPWGDVSTFEGWWVFVSGRLYRGYLFGLPLAAWPQRVLAWAGLLARQFTPLGAMVAGWGLLHLWREHRRLAGALTLSFASLSLYAIGYNTADSLVYLVSALPLAALWLGIGLAWATTRLDRRLKWVAWLILLLPALQGLLFWDDMDVSGNGTAKAWAERILGRAPPRAVLLTAEDAHTFTLWYVRDVLGQRLDVTILDRDLWAQEPYREMGARALGLETIEGDLSAEEVVRRVERPIMVVSCGCKNDH